MATLAPLVHPTTVALDDEAARPPAGLPKNEVLDRELEAIRERIEELILALGAEGTRALLVVLQGRDASGKDGVVKKVFGDVNPSYCQVHSFKRPTPLELRHDFLWRVHQVVPPAGTVGIFNRSHYEDVLVVRVRNLVPEALWDRRYQHINDFERMLVDHGVTILKFALHVSREEQRQQLEERLSDPTKNWKFEVGDLKERALWDQYTVAYQEMIRRCGTPWAPWYLVPGDKKSARDYLVAEVVLEALERMAPRYPAADPEVLALRGTIT
ncbi:MAG: polyphosphate kinase 2 family protein [Gemmatimonadetes bacterium]|nr:polyphosphate kinase 2 family protein [Gemmatimonadota bacterium]